MSISTNLLPFYSPQNQALNSKASGADDYLSKNLGGDKAKTNQQFGQELGKYQSAPSEQVAVNPKAVANPEIQYLVPHIAQEKIIGGLYIEPWKQAHQAYQKASALSGADFNSGLVDQL